MSTPELREKLRRLTRDPGPLGSAVCALLKAAEAEFPVMVIPDESRAILDLLAQQEALVAALRAIVDMEPDPFDFPADWSQQVAACEECKRWKNHPIQQGICDTHRQPLRDRDAHYKEEQLRLHDRMRSVAREALTASMNDALMKAEREIRSLDVDADARRLAALHQLIAWWDDTSWGSTRWIAELAAIVENCRAAAMADTQTEGDDAE